MARKLVITDEERQTVTELGGPWVCDVQTLAEQARINPARAAHVVMQMRGEDVHERETARYHVGQQVTVDHPGEAYNGETATIIQARPGEEFPYQVEMATPDDEGETLFWMGADEVQAATEPTSESEPVLGIGGIGIFAENEMPVIPSPAAMARMEQLQKTDIVCRRCGQSKNFDGAMFTTGGGDICDDCF